MTLLTVNRGLFAVFYPLIMTPDAKIMHKVFTILPYMALGADLYPVVIVGFMMTCDTFHARFFMFNMRELNKFHIFCGFFSSILINVGNQYKVSRAWLPGFTGYTKQNKSRKKKQIHEKKEVPIHGIPPCCADDTAIIMNSVTSG